MEVSSRYICVVTLLFAISCASALECYSRVEAKCTPPGVTCDSLKNKLIETEKTSTPCPVGRTMCSSTEATAHEQGVTLTSIAAGCLSEVEGFTVGCYGRDDLGKIDEDISNNFLAAEKALGITYDSTKICICKGELCNGAPQKAALDNGATEITISVFIILFSIMQLLMTSHYVM